MKTKWLSKLAGGKSYRQSVLFAFLIVAFIFALFPAPSAFAKSGGTEEAAMIDRMEAAWSRRLLRVHVQSLFYENVRLYPADFKNLDDLARAHDLLNRYGFVLRQAETLVFNRPGFDARGDVTNLALADQTLRELGEYMRLMRALREKLDQIPRRNR